MSWSNKACLKVSSCVQRSEVMAIAKSKIVGLNGSACFTWNAIEFRVWWDEICCPRIDLA
jgi:hypothetical protein